MKIRGLIRTLLFGIFSGLILFTIDTFDIYIEIAFWMYMLGFVFVTVFPMLWCRFKNKQESTFGSLIKVGLLNFLVAFLVSTAATFTYTYKYLNHDLKYEIINEKVAKDILNFEGSSIDIFSMDTLSYRTVNPNIAELFIGFLFSIPLYLLICIILALILKPKIELDQDTSEIGSVTTSS